MREPLTLCGLCLMGWSHEECVETTLWLPSKRIARIVHKAYREAR